MNRISPYANYVGESTVLFCNHSNNNNNNNNKITAPSNTLVLIPNIYQTLIRQTLCLHHLIQSTQSVCAEAGV